MKASFLTRALLLTAVAGAAACSDATAPSPAPIAPALAKGTGGGGTAIPTPPPTTALPTVTVSSSLFPGTDVLAGQTVSIEVVATSESGNRKAPTLTVTGAPVGLTRNSMTIADSPHGGGPGYVVAMYSWTPARDQIGLTAAATFTATTSAGSASTTLSFGTVADAPTALTGLTATAVGDHIEAHWSASTGGTGTISYVVQACYKNTNSLTPQTTCAVVTTTTDTQALDIPLVNPAPTVAPFGGVATNVLVEVTPVDAAGHQGTLGSALVQ